MIEKLEVLTYKNESPFCVPSIHTMTTMFHKINEIIDHVNGLENKTTVTDADLLKEFDFELELKVTPKETKSENDTDTEAPCDRCKHSIKAPSQYPCSHCSNCYTNKFELDEGKVENG